MREFKDSVTGKSDTSPDDGDSVGKSLGSGMREFRDSIAGSNDGVEDKRPVEDRIDGSAKEVPEPSISTPART